jgi:hypothetical protein
MKTTINIVAAICIISALNPVTAEYCGSKLIAVGESMHRIKLICGEPISKEIIGEIQSIEGNIKEKLYIAEWVYDRGDKLLILTFHGSTLAKITKLDKD